MKNKEFIKGEFVPYVIAKKLAKLDYNLPSFGSYISEYGWQLDLKEGALYVSEILTKRSDHNYLAPLYQQAFEFLQKKYKLKSRLSIFANKTEKKEELLLLIKRATNTLK